MGARSGQRQSFFTHPGISEDKEFPFILRRDVCIPDRDLDAANRNELAGV